MKARSSAVTLIEVLVIAFLISVVFLALLSFYTTTVRDATLSRERLLATMVADSTLAEIDDHGYGSPPPTEWGTLKSPYVHTFPLVIQGRPVQAIVERSVHCENGSFFGNGTKPTDTVVVMIKWWEPTGSNDPEESTDRVLIARVLVAREPDLGVRR
jgi:type II secretory pathway pseudopilin PulG